MQCMYTYYPLQYNYRPVSYTSLQFVLILPNQISHEGKPVVVNPADNQTSSFASTLNILIISFRISIIHHHSRSTSVNRKGKIEILNPCNPKQLISCCILCWG